MELSDETVARLRDTRVHEPEAILAALTGRKRRETLAPEGALFIIAADHPARGALGVGADPVAMADRVDLIRRLAAALAHPRVDGVLGSADIIEDLALLGLLDERLAVGTMNRGGIEGASWQMDDRMTAYDADHLARYGLDGGKVLLRIDRDDPGTAGTIGSCAAAVTALADRHLMAMVEPLAYTRDADGRHVIDTRVDRVVQAVTVASGLGASSARTWLKIPAGPAAGQAMSATTCPVLLMGGPLADDRAWMLRSWGRALSHPQCRGVVAGRNLLYPQDGDVTAAVAAVADLVSSGAGRP